MSSTPTPSHAPATPSSPPSPPMEPSERIGRALVAGVLLTAGGFLLAISVGASPGAVAGSIYAVVAFSVSAAMFAALGEWKALWGMQASTVASIFGVVGSVIAFGIILLQGANNAQHQKDLETVARDGFTTAGQVEDAEVAAARQRLLGGDDAEVTLRDATDFARLEDAKGLTKEILDPNTTNPRAKEAQALIQTRNAEVAEAHAKGWSGRLKDYTTSKAVEWHHLGARSDAASASTWWIYWVPVWFAGFLTIALTVYAAAQFGIKGVIKEPPENSHWLRWVQYYTDKVLFAPSTKFALGAFAFFWFPTWWANMVLEPYTPQSAPVKQVTEMFAAQYTSKPSRSHKDVIAKACAKNRADATDQGLDHALLPTVCR